LYEYLQKNRQDDLVLPNSAIFTQFCDQDAHVEVSLTGNKESMAIMEIVGECNINDGIVIVRYDKLSL
jgi:hypothetical protein